MRCSRLLLPLCTLLLSAPAGAVVHTDGDGSGHASAPLDDPGFANVGISTDGLSGVYLGNRWVLTAAHVGERSFEFQGRLYPHVAGSRRILDRDGQQADLALVRLVGPGPPLPDLALASGPAAPGEVVTLVGNGWSRAADAVCWASNWVEVPCPCHGYSGFLRGGSPRQVRWGLNAVSGVGMEVYTGNKRTRAFATLFDEAGPKYEAQAVTGDSGGAVFAKRGGEWELVGILFARSALPGQPGDTAVFGNRSYVADLSDYRDQIESALLETPAVPALPPLLLPVAAGCLLATARRRLSGAHPRR